MRIDSFKIEDWMNLYCQSAKYDLTTTCIEPLSIREMLNLCKVSNDANIFDTKLTYGEIKGSQRLRKAVSSLYDFQKIENITITLGAIGANKLIFESLLEKNDEMVVITPCYQQHYSIPKSLGVSVKSVQLKEENNWQINLRELESSLTHKTKLICLTNPNNPTGSVLSDETLKRVCEIAKQNNSWILSDEVYRGLNLKNQPYSKSIADLYEKGISVGSMSKTYSMPGLRVGWICAREDLTSEIIKHREYNTISISLLDDYFSAVALENKIKIEERNLKIIKAGYSVLNNWLNEEIYVKANLPQGGTTALVRYKKEIPSKILCREFQKETGIALLPGETMDMEGFVRIGFCINPEILEFSLKSFSKYLRTKN